MNTKTFITQNNRLSAFTSVCAVVFMAMALVFIPTHVHAGDEELYTGGLDYSYDQGQTSNDFYTGGLDYTYTQPADNYVSPSYGSYGGYESYCNTCSTGGGYSSYSTPHYQYSAPTYHQTPTYQYTAPHYVYTQPSSSGSNVNTSHSNSNASANSNSNSQGGSSTNNNVNNNTVVVYGGGSNTTPTPTPVAQTLNVYCTINPSNASVGQDVNFAAYASGANGNYQYSWYGDDGISSNSQSFTGHFNNYGTKTATVTVTSGTQSVTRTCSVNVQNNQYNNYQSAYCVGTPSNAGVNQSVTWTAYPSGNYNNTGYATYSWSGTDNLYGTGQTINTVYNTPGYKTATVNIYSNGQSVTATCNLTIAGSNVTVIRQAGTGTPVSGVFLSQVPATGIDFNMKTVLFLLGLLIWSGFVTYVMVQRRKTKMALQGISRSTLSKAEAFKMANMQKKGIVS